MRDREATYGERTADAIAGLIGHYARVLAPASFNSIRRRAAAVPTDPLLQVGKRGIEGVRHDQHDVERNIRVAFGGERLPAVPNGVSLVAADP